MQIVIEIPEEEYAAICYNVLNEREHSYGYVAIANGTPLPKGHGRLIDESLLREDMEVAYKYANELVALGFAESFLEHAPTIIEADKEDDDADSD